MTAPRPAAVPPTDLAEPRRRRWPIVVILLGAVLLAAAWLGFSYLFLQTTPAPVGLVGASASPAATSAASSAPAASADPSPAPSAAAASSGGSTGGALDGTWNVDPSVGSFSDFSGSFVGYRVEEELANVGAATAVGRTPDVTGSLTFDGSTVSAADFTRQPRHAPERPLPARRPAPPPGARDRHLPDRDVQAHEADRPRGGPGRRPGRLGHGHRRPDDPRHDEVGPDPDPGAAVRQRRDRHRLDRDRVRRLRHQPAELVHGAVDRGPRDDGVPAPAHEGLRRGRRLRRPRRSRGAGRGRPRRAAPARAR